MSKKSVEVDEKVVAIKAQMDEKVYKIRMLEVEEVELQALLDARIEELKASLKVKTDNIASRKAQLIAEIVVLAEQVPVKETKTQVKVTLLSGDVVIKKPTVKLDYDKRLLLENAEQTGLTEYITTKEVKDFDWAGLKAKLTIQEDGSIINTETGEVVDIEGLQVLPVAEQVVIK